MTACKKSPQTSRTWVPLGWNCIAYANDPIKINTQKWQASNIPERMEVRVQHARSTAQGAEVRTTGTCMPSPLL